MKKRIETEYNGENNFGAKHQQTGDVILRPIGISMAEVKPGSRNIAYKHGPVLHFDVAKRRTLRLFQGKSNKMPAFSIVET